MKDKNKKVQLIAVALLIIGVGFIGTSLLYSKENNDNKRQTPSKKYTSLMELANEMKSDGSYKILPIDDKKGVYYMTISEYKKRGYNTDIIDTSCPNDFQILNFKVDDTDNFNSIYTVSSCNDNSTENSDIPPTTSLVQLANKLYESNEYLNLSKGDGGYYMTIGMYKSMGYDTSLINQACPDDSKILLFDIENKDKYEGNPIFVIYECN